MFHQYYYANVISHKSHVLMYMYGVVFNPIIDIRQADTNRTPCSVHSGHLA